jgi:hypothetical protein
MEQNGGRTLTTPPHTRFSEIMDIEKKPELRTVLEKVVYPSERSI